MTRRVVSLLLSVWITSRASEPSFGVPMPTPAVSSMRGVRSSVVSVSARVVYSGLKTLAVTNSYPEESLGMADRVVQSLVGIDLAGLRLLF